MPKTTKNNAAFDFMSACDRTFRLFGAEYEEKDHPYAWAFETSAGPLHCHPIEDGSFCRFEHPERAKAIIGAGSLNPYSGKWNWHYDKPGVDELMDLQRNIARVVHAPEYVDSMVKTYQETLCGLGSLETDTILVYEYCDEANNKTSREVRLSGHPDTWDVGNRAKSLLMLFDQSHDNLGFIPGQLGLPDLQDSFGDCKDHWNPELDHPWHSVIGLRPVQTDDPSGGQPLMSYDQFAKNLVKLTTGPGWDESYLPLFHAPMRLRERHATA